MTWIYSSFAWRGSWSAEPQTVAELSPVLCGSACGSPRQAPRTPGAVVITPQGLLLYPHLPQECVVFCFKKLQK